MHDLKTYLRSSIARTSTSCFQSLTFFIHVTEAKVDDLELSIKVQKQIFRLEISVADAQLVNIVDSSKQLLQVLACSPLLQLLILNDQLKKLSSARKLHHEVQVLICLDDLVDLNHIGMMKLLEDFDLTADPFNVLPVFYLALL